MKELLKKLGLEEDQINKILNKHEESLTALNNSIELKDNELETLEKQLEEANSKMEELGTLSKTIEEVKQEVEDYKTKYEEAKEERETLKKTYLLKEELSNYNPYDVEDLLLYINKEDLVYKDNKFVNLDKVVEVVKENKPYWFKDEDKGDENKPKFSSPGKGGSSDTITLQEFNNMDYFARVKFKKENPQEYNNLMGGK